MYWERHIASCQKSTDWEAPKDEQMIPFTVKPGNGSFRTAIRTQPILPE